MAPSPQQPCHGGEIQQRRRCPEDFLGNFRFLKCHGLSTAKTWLSPLAQTLILPTSSPSTPEVGFDRKSAFHRGRAPNSGLSRELSPPGGR